ncbi:MAG: tetraacyldisaccharide 4'-kinase [Puniceicoccales bacterium]|jgi:tetraacyldisaccharide 4'-kinase|nr:tetraacyldisaccharide 4'-kinase [Puniceicoccales bacterium]
MRWLRYRRLKFRRRVLRPLRRLDRTAERFMTDILYERKSGVGIAIVRPFLRGLSIPFRALTALRRFLYDQRILHSQYLGCPVISVGNLTVGGTGKTPFVELLARELACRGRSVAILSRGYRSQPEPLWQHILRAITHGECTPPRVVSDGKSVLLGAEIAGDEPHMLARNLPGVAVITDRNRVHAGKFAIGHFGCDTLILDDGFQHLRLKAQLNLLLIDRTTPFGSGHLLPRGILREPPQQMKRATHIFLTKSDGTVDRRLASFLERHKSPRAPIILCRHSPKRLCEVHGTGTPIPLASLAGRRLAAFSGIAMQESFERFLEEEGAILVHRKRFPDHYRFQEEDLEKIFTTAIARGAEWVLTTEKDAVRLNPNQYYPLPTYYLRVEIEILRGEKDFQELLRRVGGQPPPAEHPAP